MTDKQIIIDVSKCKECGLRNCEGNLIYWCHTYDDHCKDFDNCYYKQLLRKEQEYEELKEDLRKSFEEKDTLHLIIDRLLEASGYDTNTASAEDFEDVYEHMRYEQQQLDQLKQTLTEIKEFFNEECIICKENYINITGEICEECKYKDILQKISEFRNERS